MAWYNFWKKQTAPVITEPSLVQAKSDLQVTDYSPHSYRAYWETIMSSGMYGWSAEVRFMSRDGTLLEKHQIDGPTKDNVEGLVAKLVKNKMELFKV